MGTARLELARHYYRGSLSPSRLPITSYPRFGGPGWYRTTCTKIFNLLLYHLSYWPIFGFGGGSWTHLEWLMRPLKLPNFYTDILVISAGVEPAMLEWKSSVLIRFTNWPFCIIVFNNYISTTLLLYHILVYFNNAFLQNKTEKRKFLMKEALFLETLFWKPSEVLFFYLKKGGKAFFTKERLHRKIFQKLLNENETYKIYKNI